MTDRDLLELAAKAAGIELVWSSETDMPARRRDTMDYWRPLKDDGDALRLAVKLHIGIRANSPDDWQRHDETIVLWDDYEGVPRRMGVEHDGNPRLATRRAIVRAAAAIGEQMP